MDRNRIFLDDQQLRKVYAQFQETRRSLGEIYPGARYDDFVDRGHYQGTALPVTMMASEHILSASNAVNRFCYDLHGLTSWAKILDNLTDDEKLPVLFEFASPSAAHCLSAPYSIKQMFIKSICHISHQTNRFCTENWSEWSLKRDKQLDCKEAENLASHFGSWPALHTALSHLNNAEFTVATDDYRNRLNHGFPRRVEFGHTMTIQRDPKLKRYVIISAPPLGISELIHFLTKQYGTSLDCYNKYIELIKEQHKIWPAAPSAG